MRTVILDIKTIADPEAIALSGDPREEFLPWPLHALACVSLFTVHRSSISPWQFHIETFSRLDMSEKAILAKVESNLEKADEVRTFNGRGFDAPVLASRASVCGLHTPTISRLHGRSNGPQFLEWAAIPPRFARRGKWLQLSAPDQAGSSLCCVRHSGETRSDRGRCGIARRSRRVG